MWNGTGTETERKISVARSLFYKKRVLFCDPYPICFLTHMHTRSYICLTRLQGMNGPREVEYECVRACAGHALSSGEAWPARVLFPFQNANSVNSVRFPHSRKTNANSVNSVRFPRSRKTNASTNVHSCIYTVPLLSVCEGIVLYSVKLDSQCSAGGSVA